MRDSRVNFESFVTQQRASLGSESNLYESYLRLTIRRKDSNEEREILDEAIGWLAGTPEVEDTELTVSGNKFSSQVSKTTTGVEPGSEPSIATSI